MKQITYDFLWTTVIQTQINIIYKELCVKYKADVKYNLKVKNLDKYKIELQEGYNSTKKELKHKFFDNEAEDREDEALIDIHKIAACYCKSALDNKVFDFDMVKTIPLELILCNYNLAFSISTGILCVNLLSEYKRSNKHKEYEYLKEKQGFVFPKTNQGHDPYALGRIKTLTLNDIYGIDFDILTYADMMYWIEEYNKYEISQYCNH